MAIVNKFINLNTDGNSQIIDITAQGGDIIAKEKIKDGMVHFFIPGATAAITALEYEPGLVNDMKNALERLAPRSGNYRHDSDRGDDNGHSHIRAAMLGPSLCVPFKNRKLTLGQWQRIVLIDCDTRPRKREIIVQIIGD